MYNLKIILLKDCPYTKLLLKLLEKHKLKNYQIVYVDSQTKKKYKSNDINTFPQIYFIFKNYSLLIGGYETFKNIVESLKVNKNMDKVKKILISNQKFNRKNILRLSKFILTK